MGLSLGALTTILFLSGGFNDLWFAVAASAPLAVLSAAGAASAVTWLGPALRNRALLAAVLGLCVSILVAALWATGSSGIIGIGWRWAGPLAGFIAAAIIGLLLGRRTGRPWLQGSVGLIVIALVAMALPARIIYAVAEPYVPVRGGSVSTVLFTPQPSLINTIDQDREIGWSNTQAAAGAHLRAIAAADDLVATNLTFGALVPSLTRLSTYISDIHMQAPYGVVTDIPEITDREMASWAFIDGPTPTSAAPLCAAGVDWVWVDPQRTPMRNWEPYASIVWSARDVVLLNWNTPACP